jgi:hypothetical protein
MRTILTAACALLVCPDVRGDETSWSGIMRDEPVIVKGAAVREEDGDRPKAPPKPEGQFLKAGTKFQEGGYWYTADGTGRGAWCAECNGISYPDFVRQWEAKRAAPVSANPPRPGGSPGFPQSTPGTTVPLAGPVSTRLPATWGTASTFTPVRVAGLRGVTSSGCVSGG